MSMVKKFKLKKAFYFGASIFFSCILTISCDQNNQFLDEYLDLETKKAEVQKLAEKYGIDYRLDKNITEDEIDLEEIEDFFIFINKINSKRLSLSFVEEGKAVTLLAANSKRLKTRSEEGGWSGYTDNGNLSVYVAVTWKKYNDDSQIFHASVESAWGDFGIGTGIEYEQTYGSAGFVDDKTISFEFQGDFKKNNKIIATIKHNGIVWIDKETGFVV